jgi:hypothetical protein
MEDVYKKQEGTQIVTIIVCNNNQDIHLRITKWRHIGTVRSISIAGEFNPANGAPNLTLSPNMFLLNKTV